MRIHEIEFVAVLNVEPHLTIPTIPLRHLQLDILNILNIPEQLLILFCLPSEQTLTH
jgi:hypothetical protein